MAQWLRICLTMLVSGQGTKIFQALGKLSPWAASTKAHVQRVHTQLKPDEAKLEKKNLYSRLVWHL